MLKKGLLLITQEAFFAVINYPEIHGGLVPGLKPDLCGYVWEDVDFFLFPFFSGSGPVCQKSDTQ